MVRIVIAEDEPLLREQLGEFVQVAWPGVHVAAVAENGLQAIRALEEHRPQAMFLDIQMPEASGLEVGRHASGRCHVVFVTAYDRYAVTAFEEGALDYVMKPLTVARVGLAVQRVKQRLLNLPARLDDLLNRLADAPEHCGDYLRWISVSKGEEIHLIAVEDIRYFHSDTKYTRVVTRNREGLIRKSIKELSEALDPADFWQVHRATIVNIHAVESAGRDLHGRFLLRLKNLRERLLVSQAFAHRFRQM